MTSRRFASRIALGLGLALVAGPAGAEEACAPGQVRQGERCMHQIAPPGACASARAGSVSSGGGGGGSSCGDSSIGTASTHFTPTDVASAPVVALNAPGPGPNPIPEVFPPNGPPVNPPPPPPPPPVAPPPIVVIESPAPPDPPPGIFK